MHPSLLLPHLVHIMPNGDYGTTTREYMILFISNRYINQNHGYYQDEDNQDHMQPLRHHEFCTVRKVYIFSSRHLQVLSYIMNLRQIVRWIGFYWYGFTISKLLFEVGVAFSFIQYLENGRFLHLINIQSKLLCFAVLRFH